MTPDWGAYCFFGIEKATAEGIFGLQVRRTARRVAELKQLLVTHDTTTAGGNGGVTTHLSIIRHSTYLALCRTRHKVRIYLATGCCHPHEPAEARPPPRVRSVTRLKPTRQAALFEQESPRRPSG